MGSVQRLSNGNTLITESAFGRIFGRGVGVVLAALLFGALHAGGILMQASTSTPLTIVTVIQALIVLFVAAPLLIRAMFRLREVRGGGTGDALAKGWNG